jgi:2',3'-cyclic-nucleotide 2'-phosphodiesterase (5'-nucleotidase family)
MKIFLLFLILVGCSFKKSNQNLKGHEQLYSKPEMPELMKLEQTEKRIVIASTNDIHGNYSSSKISFTDNHHNQTQEIHIGGQEVIKTYFQILRDTYKNVVLVDSGDIFSSADKVNDVVNFYNSNKYDALTVGLRDFNLKVPSSLGASSQLFRQFAQKSQSPLILSNLYELKTARAVEWEGTKTHLIKEVDGVKVGIIGLVPDDIVPQTPIQNRVGFYVESMLQSTLRHARLLRSLGAEIIVVLSHQGIDCNSQLAEQTKLPPAKVNFDPHKKNICEMSNPLGEYLKRLPPNLVDVFVGGRNHQKTANFVNGILVMSSFADGKSFSFAEFVVDTKLNKVVPSKTIPHQPVFFCHEFFKETNDCFSEDKSVDHKRRIPATFLGAPINQVTETSTSQINFSKPDQESIVKNLNNFNADLSYITNNSGETQLIVIHLKGRELLKILEQDYNLNSDELWQPSPFVLKNDQLQIKVNGMSVEHEKDYRILTDLESALKHHLLHQKVASFESEALIHHSWNSVEEDSVSTQLAAQIR